MVRRTGGSGGSLRHNAAMIKSLLPCFVFVSCSMVETNQGDRMVFESRSVELEGVRYPYQLLLPRVEAESAPLVVFLHGAGERGSDNTKQLTWLPLALAGEPMRTDFGCYVLAVQCPLDEKWVDVQWGDASPSAMLPVPSRAMRAVMAAIEQVEQEKQIDRQRIYCTGLSMGGYGAWDLVMRMPEKFAACVPVCGGGDPSQVARLRDLPIWIWHGDKDAAVPVERSRQMATALEQIGANARYTELKGVGHDSWRQAYASDGALQWMFAQRKG